MPEYVGSGQGYQGRESFDNIDHELLMKAVRRHTDCRWVVLYIERWLKADVLMPDGVLMKRDKGTPQGGVMTPPTKEQNCSSSSPRPSIALA
jgi:hypothetical protein